MRLTKHQRTALEQVAAGRVYFGADYPALARRAAAHGNAALTDYVFLVDNYQPHGSAKRTLPSLEERGLIIVRHDLVPTVRVRKQTKTYRSISGAETEQVIPAHDEPKDPGWRTNVELTDAGRAALG